MTSSLSSKLYTETSRAKTATTTSVRLYMRLTDKITTISTEHFMSAQTKNPKQNHTWQESKLAANNEIIIVTWTTGVVSYIHQLMLIKACDLTLNSNITHNQSPANQNHSLALIEKLSRTNRIRFYICAVRNKIKINVHVHVQKYTWVISGDVALSSWAKPLECFSIGIGKSLRFPKDHIIAPTFYHMRKKALTTRSVYSFHLLFHSS